MVIVSALSLSLKVKERLREIETDRECLTPGLNIINEAKTIFIVISSKTTNEEKRYKFLLLFTFKKKCFNKEIVLKGWRGSI